MHPEMLCCVITHSLSGAGAQAACSRVTLGGCRADLAVNQRRSLVTKCEDVKTPLLSAEPSERGEQGLISLQLCAK